MNKAIKIFSLGYILFLTKISVAQMSMDSLILNSEKIDFENLKQLSDTFYHSSFNCDCDTCGSETNRELRYCLNIRLQHEDALLNKRLSEIIEICENSTDTLYNGSLSVKKIKLTQELWERYRYAYCNECLGLFDSPEKGDVFFFLHCAIKLTIKRREDIERICNY